MPSTFLFLSATLLLSLNLVRPLGLSISDWLYFGSIIFALLETAFIKHSKITYWTRNVFIWPAILISLGALISLANARVVSAAIFELFQQIYIISLFVSLTWIMVKRGKTSQIVYAFIFSGVFTALITIIDFSLGTKLGSALSGTPGVQFWGWARYAGTLGHPNKFGYYLVLTTILSFFVFLQFRIDRKTMLRRIFWLALLFIQVFGLYLSGSVTAYVGIVFGIALLLFKSKKYMRRVFAMTGTTVLIIILTLIIGIVLGRVDFFETIFQSKSLIASGINRVQETTAEARVVNYNQALAHIIQSPLIGVGYDQISTSGIDADVRILSGTIHNPLLQIFYVGGVFSFIGWLLIYIYIGIIAVRRISQSGPNAPSFVLAVSIASLSILLMDQFQDAIYQREKWLVIGLLLGHVWEQTRIKRSITRLNN